MPKNQKIAVVMELEWPYKRHYEIFAGIREYAEERGGWDLDLGNFPQFEIQQGRKYDGIIGRISADCYEAAGAGKIPVVNVQVDSPIASIAPGVHPDCKMAGRMAAEHLISIGFKRLVHFGYRKRLSSKLHYEGMLEVAREHGCACKRYVVDSTFREQESSWRNFVLYVNKALETWQAPIGIGFSSDELGHAVITICKARGWSIPDQMAVIGVGNEVMICNSSNPTLSSIDMSQRNCGYEAARLLDKLMSGKKLGEDLITRVAPKELVLRRSSDAYAVEDPAMVRALLFMSENSHRRISVTDISKAAGLGRQTLEHRFRKQLNRTVNDELIRLRISKMKRLLVETQQTIGDISDQVGFGTTANMHVMFKRFTQMTPIAYREKHNPKLNRDLSK
jgi:LacI family transcriptional regulator